MGENNVDPDIVQRFDTCAFSRLLGMRILETWDGGARVVMESGGKENAMGVVHGGAIFALADQAFGIAANQGGSPHVAVSVHISYLAPARGRLEAVARRISQTEDRVLYAIRVTEGDRLVAEFEGLAWKV